MKCKTIRQSIRFRASSEDVFHLLTNSEAYAAFTGSEVRVSLKTGASFTTFGGYCTIVNVAVEAPRMIVQDWNFREKNWPVDHFSRCYFLIEDTPTGCVLRLAQNDVPAEYADRIREGWKTYYWLPMKSMLLQNKKSDSK